MSEGAGRSQVEQRERGECKGKREVRWLGEEGDRRRDREGTDQGGDWEGDKRGGREF